jgi:purine-nucleoside/S-methyl-5'-thioadenosine phosphorylase / adenosine deaminase
MSEVCSLDDIAASGLDWIVPEWPAPPGIHALSTTRNGAHAAPVDFSRHNARIGDAHALLRRFCPEDPVRLMQEHGTAIYNADVVPAAMPRADAAIARLPGRVCAVTSADCLPVLLTDRVGSVVAAAHAGWRGLSAGVLERCIAALGVPAHTLMAWLGPAIGPQAFEVGPDVLHAFCTVDPDAAGCFVATGKQKWNADLYALARLRLARIGVHDVHGGGHCTYSESTLFYSYRRGAADAACRMLTAIWRTPR